ncbi:MAG: fimbria/pilus outer membrane usher protein [Azovibrio sp.]
MLTVLWGASLSTAALAADETPPPKTPASPPASEEYNFDDSLFMGQPFGGRTLSRFNRANAIEPGSYQVDIFINNNFVSRAVVDFKAAADGEDVSPCLSDYFLVDSGILPESMRAGLAPQSDVPAPATTPTPAPVPATPRNKTDAEANTFNTEPVCLPMEQRLPGASSRFDLSRLRLDISIPQLMMSRKPRGFVNPDDLDAGATMAFSNYNLNYYHSDSRQGNAGSNTSDFAFLGLNSGINLGMWRLRHQGSYRYSSFGGTSQTDWQNINTYVQRALPDLNSELTLGESFTEGSLFSSLAFRGVRLGTDERMLPDSLRGYAPEIRGIATTNARVVVRQNGISIYETNVTPGPFIIDDLSGTSTAGDLNVEVIEADGRRSTFTVPFTAVPLSMRPGTYRYNATVGQVRDRAEDTTFAELTYQYGLSNMVTLNAGTRVAQNYFAGLAGGVLATSYGAFGLNNTFSSSRIEGQDRKTGWRTQVSYSQTIQPTSTNVSLSAYRYSTDGYRDLGDILTMKDAMQQNTNWFSNTYQQRNQFTATINQSLGSYGQIFLSASTSDYYNARNRDTQMQFGYSNVWKQISYGVTYTRQDIRQDTRSNTIQVPGFASNQVTTTSDNQLMFTLSFPLGSSPRAPYVSSSVSRRSSGGTTYQSSLSGTLDEAQTTTYGIDAMYDDDSNVTTFGGSLQKRLPMASIGGNISSSSDFWQASANARGAFVVHGGGMTLGPYLGDTFGLIEAKGASGAEVRNGQGARVDSAGYALIPTLMPYRYNEVSLKSDGINAQAELQENQRRIAPYAGATVKIEFKTLMGYALLMKVKLVDDSQLPLGANVLDDQNKVIGMVGQASQIYARAENIKGSLKVRWGDQDEEGCTIPYDLSDVDQSQALIRLNGICTP